VSAFLYTPLLTDFYQLTMAYGYWKLGIHEQEAAFHLLFRKNPFNGNYALCAGLESLVDFLMHWRFHEDDLIYLSTLSNHEGESMFPERFLDYLSKLKFSCDLDAIPEGTIVFANEPLLRVQGPLLQCQLIETAVLNMINFQTLIATKTTRICRAAQGAPVIEFGMRRAQGPNGALSASRAAYIGGATATSNTLAGKYYDIPLRGTHAHSWITAFENEKTAFEAYASVMPHNCVLLVDTFNTIEGVKNAIETGKKLRELGADLLGVRLDSGDMATLSIETRKLLDEAGFKNTDIMASNSLDEYVISDLKKQQAKISSFGVGTHLVTAYDHPALDGVYKLSSIKDKAGKWIYKLKISEEEVKISNPGRHQVRRFFSGERYVLDVIYDLDLGISDTPEVVIPDKNFEVKRLDDYDGSADLLKNIIREGQVTYPLENIHDIRKHAIVAAEDFYKSHGEAVYYVALEKKLFDLKRDLVEKLKV
jgi:nicotinate phosphoribosyltransferase